MTPHSTFLAQDIDPEIRTHAYRTWLREGVGDDELESARERRSAARFSCGFAVDREAGTAHRTGLNSLRPLLRFAHACVPILKRGMDWYDGWHSIIVYPDAFIPRRPQTDAAGVVHQTDILMAGEAWARGPMILSWADVLNSRKKPGHNGVIHEMAHKLDMLNGDANGFPPLHRRMDHRVWSQVFSSAWDRLQDEQRNGAELPIDPYALESPAEFFAVVSEQFSKARQPCASICRTSIGSLSNFTGSTRSERFAFKGESQAERVQFPPPPVSARPCARKARTTSGDAGSISGSEANGAY